MRHCVSCEKPLRITNKSGMCSAHYKKWWEQNKRDTTKKTASLRAWYQKNKEQRAIYSKNYRAQNPEICRQADLKKVRENPELYRDLRLKRERIRLKSDPQFRLAKYLRNTIYVAIREKAEHAKAIEFLGCSIAFYLEYIGQKFTEGMSWDNYGEWHLDHILPLDQFNLEDREQFLKAAHFSNTQPLWATDNILKRNRPAGPTVEIGGI